MFRVNDYKPHFARIEIDGIEFKSRLKKVEIDKLEVLKVFL